MDPLVSVIIPVYRAEAYLEQCMDSVLKQTLREIEIILVDDGSPDRCPEMCDRYAVQDHRVRVIHQKNAGVSAARNAGIDAAQGDWIMFVDADDWLELNGIEVLYQQTKEVMCDLIIGSYFRTYMDCETYAGKENTETFHLFPAPEYTKHLMAGCFTAASRNPQLFPAEMKDMPSCTGPVAKLYRRDFLKKECLYFDEDMKFHEDLMFNLRIMNIAQNVCFFNAPVYHYRIRNGSTTGAATKDGRHAQVMIAFDKLNSFIQECGFGQQLLSYLQLCIVIDILRMIQRYCEYASYDEDILTYVGLLEQFTEHEGIRKAVNEVSEEQVSNRDYRPMLTMLKEGQYQALLLKYKAFYQGAKGINTKKKFL